MLQVTLIDTSTGASVVPRCVPYRDSAGGAWVIAVSEMQGPGAMVAVPVTADFENVDEMRESMQCSAGTLGDLYRTLETLVQQTSLAGLEAWFYGVH